MSEFRLINTNGGVALLLGKYKYHKVGIQSDNYNWGKDNNVTQTPEMANEASLQEANRKFGELIGQELNNVPVVKRRQIMFEIIRIIELRSS